jgi:hypothetical protein
MFHFLRAIDWGKVATVVSAFLTPVIAITTATIAYQQFRLNKNQFRLALLERRLRVYEATIELIATILKTATVVQDDLTKFLVGTSERDFLFGKDVSDFLDGVYGKAVDLYAVGHPAPPAQVPQWNAAILWFSGKTEDARKAFSKYIAFR